MSKLLIIAICTDTGQKHEYWGSIGHYVSKLVLAQNLSYENEFENESVGKNLFMCMVSLEDMFWHRGKS